MNLEEGPKFEMLEFSVFGRGRVKSVSTYSTEWNVKNTNRNKEIQILELMEKIGEQHYKDIEKPGCGSSAYNSRATNS